MPYQTEPRLTGHGRHPTTGELLHFTVEGCGERVVVAKTDGGKWKAGEWKTMEEIAAEHRDREERDARLAELTPGADEIGAANRILAGKESDSFLMSDARLLARKLLDRKAGSDKITGAGGGTPASLNTANL